MEGDIFFERYRLCRDVHEKPLEIGRTGAAIIYQASDERSNQPVLLQLIPRALIDQSRAEEFDARIKAVREIDHINVAHILAAGVQHDYFAFATEDLTGETADAWVVAHGPLPPDAVMRIGLQVVRATAAAAFHGLTHRAIQPSNIIILHGESPSGGWPFIKLLNFGISALELHGHNTEAHTLAPPAGPVFASPEQLLDREIDFRSEMYSLGATMCFLLTGAVPLPANDATNLKRAGRRRLPQLNSIPKSMRRLLSVMLAEDPDYRPVDPVALEGYIISILGRLERRQAIRRKLGIPLAANMQRKIMRSRSPFAQVVRGALVFAVLLIALAAFGAILYPKFLRQSRPVEEIGIPIGVPVAEVSNDKKAPIQAPSTAAKGVPPSQPAPVSKLSPAGSTAVVKNQLPVRPVQSPSETQTAIASNLANVNASKPDVSPGAAQASPTLVAASTATPAPFVRNFSPDDSVPAFTPKPRAAPSPPTIAKASSSPSTEPEAPSTGPDNRERRSVTSTHLSTTERQPAKHSTTKSLARNDDRTTESRRGRWRRPRVIGVTAGGRMLFRLPSGKIVAIAPRHQRTPVAVRPRVYYVPEPPPDYYGPPPYGYAPPGYGD